MNIRLIGPEGKDNKSSLLGQMQIPGSNNFKSKAILKECYHLHNYIGYLLHGKPHTGNVKDGAIQCG